MNKILGTAEKPLLLLHGGAGSRAVPDVDQARKRLLAKVGEDAMRILLSGKNLMAARGTQEPDFYPSTVRENPLETSATAAA